MQADPAFGSVQAEPVYVWRRDTTRKPRTWSYWVAGALMALCLFGEFANTQANNPGPTGRFIGIGVIGAVLFLLIPPVFDFGRRKNPDITMEGREMVWAKVRVPIDQVDRYRVRRETTLGYNGTTATRMVIGTAEFSMIDGETKTFTFAHLSKDEVLDLRAAIEPVLPGRRID